MAFPLLTGQAPLACMQLLGPSHLPGVRISAHSPATEVIDGRGRHDLRPRPLRPPFVPSGRSWRRPARSSQADTNKADPPAAILCAVGPQLTPITSRDRGALDQLQVASFCDLSLAAVQIFYLWGNPAGISPRSSGLLKKLANPSALVDAAPVTEFAITRCDCCMLLLGTSQLHKSSHHIHFLRRPGPRRELYIGSDRKPPRSRPLAFEGRVERIVM